MEPVKFENAYFIKLGGHGGWEEESIGSNRAIIGWKNQNVQDINTGDWKKIREELRIELQPKGAKPGKITQSVNMLKAFTESKSDDVWITFSRTKLYWCRLDGLVCWVDEANTNDKRKFRHVMGAWRDRDILGRVLRVEDIPSSVRYIQRFGSAICKVNAVDDLRRLLNGENGNIHEGISKAYEELVKQTEKGIRALHPAEFESLAELLFSKAGWQRISRETPGSIKYYDFEYEEPITGRRDQVQVKSSADTKDFEKYKNDFSSDDYDGLYFIVHTPEPDLEEQKVDDGRAHLVLAGRLARLTVDLGLSSWLLKKVRCCDGGN